MTGMPSYFVKDDGRKLPVSDQYLLPLLSPTSQGTNYWDSPPPSPLNERQEGRILLQLHQILHLFQEFGVELEGKVLLDIGTGNGLIPRLLLEFSPLGSAVGIDPYPDGEHMTSWQPHNRDAVFLELREFMHLQCPETLDFSAYRGLVGYESFTLRPLPVAYRPQKSKSYRFAAIGAHDLERLEAKFDVFYCKAIEHIQDWDGIFRAMAGAAKRDAVVYLKHRSFFSYLGPHRYASTNIPWGHLLLTDDEYRRFAREFHLHRAAKMIEFYFRGLSYPRTTVSEMLRIASSQNFIPVGFVVEPPRFMSTVYRLIDEIEGFWEMIAANHPNLSVEEMFSGMYHVLLRKVG